MKSSRTSRPAKAGLVIAAAGGAVAATVLTLATVAFLTPDAWPGDVSPAVLAGSSRAGEAGGVIPANATSSEFTDSSQRLPGEAGKPVDLVQLQTALEQAKGERAQLSASLVTLNRDVLALDVAVESLLSQQAAQDVVDPEAATQEPVAEAEPDPVSAAPQRRQGRWAIADNLVAAGLDPQTATDLQRRQDAWQLERLELIDLAEREGWIETDRYEQELDALSALRPNLREELGDDGWDRYLIEAGRRNRVSIASIIPGSAADTAGLQVGDVVVDYGEQRVFSPSDLQDATRSGARGEAVTITVQRGGSSQILNTERGPLGVTLSRQRSDP